MTDELKLAPNHGNNIGFSLGITETMISTMIHTFYTKVRNDPFIGPIFINQIGEEWDDHLVQMCNFWSGIALSTKRYKGQPMIKHVNLPPLTKEHFARWLLLFEENAYIACPKEAADYFIEKAKKIAESLMMGIEYYKENLKS